MHQDFCGLTQIISVEVEPYLPLGMRKLWNWKVYNNNKLEIKDFMVQQGFYKKSVVQSKQVILMIKVYKLFLFCPRI